jgi:L-malate glycosyltransferase
MNNIKVCLLSDADCIHTYRWAEALSDRGIKVIVCSLKKSNRTYNDKIKIFNIANYRNQRGLSHFHKLLYLKSLIKLKRVLDTEAPDILHAHYATSYGLLGSLCRFKPLIISVWGSDVFDFPLTGYLARKMLSFNLEKADLLLSTSHIMVKETQKYTDKPIIVTPFGVDTNLFTPSKTRETEGNLIKIGLVKLLEKKYGIEYLIKAVKIVKESTNSNIQLIIGGDGSQKEYLRKLAKEIGIENLVLFKGFVNYSDVPELISSLDICVIPSILDSESFGVAAVEASASGKPVIASDAGGLPEVIENDVTGIIVKPKSPQSIAEAIIYLIKNPEIRKRYGINGRKRVEELYNWENNVTQMLGIYRNVLNGRN